jgi:hypothetical protein
MPLRWLAGLASLAAAASAFAQNPWILFVN